MNNFKTSFLFTIVLVFLFSGASMASNNDDPVFLRVEGHEITLSEFEDIYRKSNVESVVADPKTPEEYLEMYIDFRLKVLEAQSKGLDTLQSFLDELKGYRQQLAQQYLVDNKVTDQLVEEAYERLQYDIRASHILLNLSEHASPADTLAAYNRLMEIRERALDGEPFADLARQYSDDPSASDREGSPQQPGRRGNGGDLGYFTVFNMVYPFETAAYNTPPGDISLPARTSFGYHIVKVTDRLPAMGTAQVAHIMLMTPQGMPEEELEAKEQRIHEIYQMIQDGAELGELAEEFSEDMQSAQNNGIMPPFTSNRMVPQFIKAISQLGEEGEVSEPLRSDFGWHIIQLVEKNPPGSFDEVEEELNGRIQRDARSSLGQEVVIERLKEEYHLELNTDALEAFYDVLDEAVFAGEWDRNQAGDLHDELVRFGEKSFSQQDFADYIDKNQRRQNPMEIPHYVNKMVNDFIDKEIMAYENGRLEEKYPDFRQVMQEYHDGILLFEITDQIVWSKATADTTALRSFYEEHAGAYNWEGFNENRGAIIAEYQNYLEKKWVAELRKKFNVHVNRDLLPQINKD
jgi:peptidyl-prolyl cis-trans isomerase SurA